MSSQQGMIALQDAFALGYETLYADLLAVQSVLEDFAKRFSLPASLCTAWHHEIKLGVNDVLQQVWC